MVVGCRDARIPVAPRRGSPVTVSVVGVLLVLSASSGDDDDVVVVIDRNVACGSCRVQCLLPNAAVNEIMSA